MLGSVHFLDGGGQMADAIRAFDWSSSDLGPPDAWPPALKTAVGMALSSRFPKCVVWGPGLASIPNDAFRPILGDKPPALGRSFADVWSEAWDEIGPIAERAYAGEPTFIENFPLTIDRYGYPEPCYFTFCYSPIRDEHGAVRGMIDTVVETTATVEAQKQARLVNGELGHRMRNLMTVISSIVNQTLQSTGVEGEARDALVQRISALGHAQTLLTGSHRENAQILDVVHQALAPFDTGADVFELDGPPVGLSSGQSLMLALAMHELATNAVKYGALSVQGGKVRIGWDKDHPGRDAGFRLIWVETGGPAVTAPSRRGFGSRVVEKALAQEFRGEVELVYDPAGLRCELRAPALYTGDD